ncbi:MAG TPA: hypothetical protein VGP72_23100 [Planctomycetota bacterium]
MAIATGKTQFAAMQITATEAGLSSMNIFPVEGEAYRRISEAGRKTCAFRPAV